MTMTNGSTRAVEIGMDVLALLSRHRAGVATVLALNAAAIKAQVSGDPILKKAEDYLGEIPKLNNPTDKDAHAIRARQCVENVLNLRVGDPTLEEMRRGLLEHDRATAVLIEKAEAFIREAATVRATRSDAPHFAGVDTPILSIPQLSEGKPVPHLEVMRQAKPQGFIRRFIEGLLRRAS